MSSRKLLLRQIYLYLICLVSAVIFLFVVGNGLWGVVEMAMPQLTISEYDYKIVSSYEHFKTSRPKTDRAHLAAEIEVVDEDELRRRYEDERRLILDAERRGGLREFVRMWVWTISRHHGCCPITGIDNRSPQNRRGPSAGIFWRRNWPLHS
jgi:hypothetical protein